MSDDPHDLPPWTPSETELVPPHTHRPEMLDFLISENLRMLLETFKVSYQDVYDQPGTSSFYVDLGEQGHLVVPLRELCNTGDKRCKHSLDPLPNDAIKRY